MRTKLLKRFIALCMVLMVIMPASSVWAESVITDAALAKAIRAELKLSPNGEELKIEDLQKLTSLYPKNTDDKIASLQGLEHAVHMRSLFLPGHSLTDITPIGELKQLTFLAVSGNQITDLSPLSGLSALQKLVIDGNGIKNLEPLSNLSALTDLLASNNQVSDLRPIQNLKLGWIIMSRNEIQDLEPLRNHPTLQHLYLDNNLIQDIEVLETIPNLQTVSLANNPLNEQAGQIVKKLGERGVTVNLIDKKEAKPKEIKVSLNAEPVAFDIPPFIQDGNTMVPFRAIFEKLGLKVTWIEDTQTIVGEKEGTTIRMQIGNPSADVNGKPIQLAAAPTIVSGSTFVPLRFVAESVDAKVEWDGTRQLVIIRSKQRFTSSDGSVAVSTYGKWTTFTAPNKFDRLAIKTFSWSTLVVSVVPKQELPPGMDLNQFYKDAKTQLLTEPKAYFIEETEESFQGHPAKKLVHHRTEEGWKDFVCTSLFFEANGRFYQITAAANEDILKSAQEELNGIVNSLELIKQ